MHYTMARLRGAGSLLLNPQYLIDWLLDQLEELSVAMLPSQPEMVPCREFQDRTRFD